MGYIINFIVKVAFFWFHIDIHFIYTFIYRPTFIYSLIRVPKMTKKTHTPFRAVSFMNEDG